MYTSLTGDAGDPFPFFLRLLNNALPGTATINSGPNFDDPYPLGILSFWTDQNTFGKDEAQDLINTKGGLVSSAFWLVLEGFSSDAFHTLNISVPTPTGTFASLGGVSVTPTPATPGGPIPPSALPQFEDPSNTKAPQRIRFSFDVTFSNLSSFPSLGGNPVLGELSATAQVGGSALAGATASATFELLGGADPYFSNLDPTNQKDIFYLSQDLRVFSVTAGNAPLMGAPAFTTDPYGSIQSLIGYLNGSSSFTTPVPPGTDPLNQLPGQTGYETGDSSVTPKDSAGNQNYNFALARVRLRGSSGSSAQNVRVFFRLFVAQSCDTDFQPTTTYKSTPGTSGADLNLPVFPLPSGTGLVDPSGQTVQTIPFFATDASGTHDYDGTVASSNIQNIQIPATADSVWTYFGCFLDVFDATNNSKFGGTHHCIVAEIAYDGAPIPTTSSGGTTPSPANWDQLAQRNLQITSSENPKSPATHIVPQAFDIRPSAPSVLSTGAPLDLPDELMIDWGNTPPGSTATIYWPQVQSADVLALAGKIYASHRLSAADANTVQCTVTKGVSYVPIPPATGVNFAGLLTIDLPTSVRNGQEFNIVLRRVSTVQVEMEPPPKIAAVPAHRPAAPPKPIHKHHTAGGIDSGHVPPMHKVPPPSDVIIWRQVSGAFQVRIPVTTRAVMLPIEENTLAVLKWRLENMLPVYRWYPVLQRYTGLISGRVGGLGGDPGSIPPTLGGLPSTGGGGGKHGGGHPGTGPEHEYTGKIAGLVFDRFGDFEGFLLRTETGKELRFRSEEDEVKDLVREAWEERWVVTVVVEHHHLERPRAIVLRRAPRY